MTHCEHKHARCQTPTGHSSEACRFLCQDCGEEFETDGPGCIQGIAIKMNFTMPIAASAEESQTAVPKEVTQAIGEILIEYALAENTLWRLLKELPGHRERGAIARDMNRLEESLPKILQSTPDVEGLRSAFESCVRDLRTALDAINSKRNALAHGQLVGSVSETITIVASGEHVPSEPGGNWLEISHPDHGTVSLTEPEISKVLEAAVGLRRQVGVFARLAEFQRYACEDM